MDHWEILLSLEKLGTKQNNAMRICLLMNASFMDIHCAGIALIDPEYKTDWM